MRYILSTDLDLAWGVNYMSYLVCNYQGFVHPCITQCRRIQSGMRLHQSSLQPRWWIRDSRFTRWLDILLGGKNRKSGEADQGPQVSIPSSSWQPRSCDCEVMHLILCFCLYNKIQNHCCSSLSYEANSCMRNNNLLACILEIMIISKYYLLFVVKTESSQNKLCLPAVFLCERHVIKNVDVFYVKRSSQRIDKKIQSQNILE